MEKIEKYQNLIANLLEQQVAPLRQLTKGEVQEQISL